MVAIKDTLTANNDATFLAVRATMAKKFAADGAQQPHRGRPPAINVDPDELKTMADTLEKAAKFLRDAVELMAERNLAYIKMRATTVKTEYVPGVSTFAKLACVEAGEAIYARDMNTATKLERNQAHYQKYGRRKKP